MTSRWISLVRTSLACAALTLNAHAADVAGYKEYAAAFFDQQCLDCHDAETKKGGLDLTKIDPTMAGQTDLWTTVYDRVQDGEMPPKSRKTRPSAAEIEKLLSWIEPRLTEADHAKREVALRRLNRVEYQNTIRDLLGVDLDFSSMIPPDQKAGGFDNNGAALAVSTDQMEGYLKAASLIANKVLVPGEKPKTVQVVADPVPDVLEWVTKYPTNTYAIVDGMAASFKSERSDYSQIASRQHGTKKAGLYRFKFQAKALNTADKLVFVARTNRGQGYTDSNVGYYEVGPELTTIEIVTPVAAYSNLQLFPLGLPNTLPKEPEAKYPGVAFGKIEMTGPLAEVWPPETYTRLIGTLDVTEATAADARTILASFMPKAFRRHVEPAELDRYTNLAARELESGRDFITSLRTALRSVLCSPNFLYLREDVRPGTAKITDVELASRLSYFLWSSMPDAELIKLAVEGRLHEPSILHAQVERLLKDERSTGFVKNFTGQWLHLREINDTTPDEKVYPKFDELLQVAMVGEGESFFREILDSDLPLSSFLNSDFVMVNERLAAHYGLSGVKGMALRKVSLPADSVRGGVLTQAGVLKVTANGTSTSPVVRGAWVLENILGRPSPPPPPNVGAIEPDIRGAVTVRQQLEKHRHETSCNACHQYIDPPGFALESFDPTGDFRTKYAHYEVTDAEKGKGKLVDGADVDATGQLSDGRPFADIRDFKKLLMTSQDDFTLCLTRKLLAYGLGRDLGFSDRPTVESIRLHTAKNGNGLRTLVHAIVESEVFAIR